MIRSSLLSVLLFSLLGCPETPLGPVEGAGQGLKRPSNQERIQASGAQTSPLADPILEAEPNDSRENAQPILPLQPVRGSLNTRKDEDWFVMTTSEEQILRVELVECSGFNPVLELFDSTGKKLRRSVNNGGDGSGEVITNFHVLERVYLRVKLARKGKKSWNEDNQYTILAALNHPRGGEEKEPNGSVKKATVLALDRVTRGFLNVPEDVDVFQGPTPTDDSGEWAVSLLAPPGTPLIVDLAYGKGPSAAVARVRGGKRLSMRGLRVRPSEPLTVSIRAGDRENVEASYRLQLERTLLAGPPPSEPNDTVTAALEMKESPSDWIGWPGDRDVWRLSNRKAGILSVTIRGVPGLALAATVLNLEGTVLARTRGRVGRNIHLPNVGVGSDPRFLAIEAHNQGVNQTTPYTIETTWRSGKDEEQEPNDSQSSAWRHASLESDAPRRAYIGWENDVDFHPLDWTRASGPGILSVRVDAPESVTLKADWLGSSGEVTLDGPVIPAGESRTLTTLVVPERYAIRVQAVSGSFNAETPYTVTVIE